MRSALVDSIQAAEDYTNLTYSTSLRESDPENSKAQHNEM